MIALYIHVPFCVGKCRYCGFYSTTYSPAKADAYLHGLRREAELNSEIISRGSLASVYIGGGTPTALSPEQLQVLFDIIREHFPIESGIEFTVEANPSTVTEKNLSCLLQHGVNRLSLGVQALADDALQSLGRPHTAKQAFAAFETARGLGFGNIGVDLIYGIPGQSEPHWEGTLDAALALKPEHVSVYGLSLDEGSEFKRAAREGTFVLPDDELTAVFYERAVQKLRGADYVRYELSNFSLPGLECRHNLNYWARGEYLGLGPGAWSFIARRRYSTIPDTEEYAKSLSIGRAVVDAQETVGPLASARETVMLDLRTASGLELKRFERAYGTALFRRLERNADPLREAGFLVVGGGRMKLTDRGILLFNEVLARLSA